MTIMDDEFARSLGLPRHITPPIPVKGIAAAFKSTEYVTFDVSSSPEQIQEKLRSRT